MILKYELWTSDDNEYYSDGVRERQFSINRFIYSRQPPESRALGEAEFKFITRLVTDALCFWEGIGNLNMDEKVLSKGHVENLYGQDIVKFFELRDRVVALLGHLGGRRCRNVGRSFYLGEYSNGA